MFGSVSRAARIKLLDASGAGWVPDAGMLQM